MKFKENAILSYLFLALILLLTTPAFADYSMGATDVVVIVGGGGLHLVNLLALIYFAVIRLARKSAKGRVGLHVCCCGLLLFSSWAILALGDDIDRGFFTYCIAIGLLGILLIVWNYRRRIPQQGKRMG
ncbi:MAG: hypothetical protein ACFB10_20230 [Salibacteraceae bacterium]